MPEIVPSSRIAGVVVVHLDEHPDERGRFVETYRASWFEGAPLMLQGNRSDSRAGVLRGLHYHRRQSDYWYTAAGRMFVALYDLRPSSPTRGNVHTLEMGDGAPRGVYIPPGVAHGFLALTDATMTYLVDQYYDGSDELGIRYDDPATGIEWPAGALIVSDRDRSNPLLSEIPTDLLPA